MLSFVLSRRNFRENDQIISFYTLNQGKIEVLARGVKKIISKNSAFLEPGSLVEVDVVAGKEIIYLTKVQPVNLFIMIRSDLDKLLIVGYGLSIADKLLKSSVKDERIFHLLNNWLVYLNDAKEPSVNLAYSFIAKLSFLLGVSPKLDRCVYCDQEKLFGFYYFGGGAVCAVCVGRVRERGQEIEACNTQEFLEMRVLWTGNWIDADLVKHKKILKIIHKFVMYYHERKFAYFSGI